MAWQAAEGTEWKFLNEKDFHIPQLFPRLQGRNVFFSAFMTDKAPLIDTF